MKFFTFFLSFFLLVPISVYADDQNKEILFTAKSFKCSWGPGAFTLWEGEEFNIKIVEGMGDLFFDSIDWKENKARLTGGRGSGDVIIIRHNKVLHLVEATGFGGMNTTSIFANSVLGSHSGPENIFLAVHSRHITTFTNDPMLSQYYGKCEIWDIDQ